MPRTRASAVVLRRMEYSETSQILVLFTRESGKVHAIAKGIRRGTKTRFAAGVDLLDIGEVVYSMRSPDSTAMATVTEWKQTMALPGLREALHRNYAGQYIAEITAQLTEDFDAHPGLFDHIVTALSALAEASEPYEAVVGYAEALLTAVGSWPQFEACVRCRRSSNLTHFSSWEGGMICRQCEPAQTEKKRVTPQTLAVLRGQAARRGAEGAFALLNYHIAHLAGKEPKLARYLLSPARNRRGAPEGRA